MINASSILEAREFKVGDELGWKEPGSNDTSMYNQWAERNRFQIGDDLGKYMNLVQYLVLLIIVTFFQASKSLIGKFHQK